MCVRRKRLTKTSKCKKWILRAWNLSKAVEFDNKVPSKTLFNASKEWRSYLGMEAINNNDVTTINGWWWWIPIVTPNRKLF